MEMKYGLLRAGAAVEDGSVIRMTHRFCEFGREKEQPADQLGITWFQIVQRGDRLFRDNQQMQRGLRLYVVDGDVLVILIRDLGRNLLSDDFGEKSVGHSKWSVDSG